MTNDVDSFLLDRVFQPAADAVSDRMNCFALARLCLIGALFLQTAVLAWDLNLIGDHVQLALITMGTLAEYGAAQAVRAQIGRAERQSRPGMVNIARITLQPFRLLWIGFACAGGAFWMTSQFRAVDFCSFAVGVLWVLTVYFMSCMASPPRQRVHNHSRSRRLAPAFAGAL